MSLAPRYRVPLCLLVATLAGFALFSVFGVSFGGSTETTEQDPMRLTSEDAGLPTLRSRQTFKSMDVEAGTSTLHGHVVDGSGTPLEGIKVILLPEHDEPWHETDPLGGGGELFSAPTMRLPPIAETVTGPEGGFTFENLRSGQNYDAIPVVEPPLYGAGRWVWVGHRKPAHVTLRVLTGTRDVKVRVVGADGEGLESYVRFYCREGRKKDPTRAWWTEPYAKTDADGRISLKGAPARLFWARVWAPGIGARSGLRIEKDAKGEIELRLGDEGGPVAQGRVMDAQGRPIANAQVWGSTSDDALDISHGVYATTTNDEGRYRIGPMSKGLDLRVNAVAPGHMLGVVIWPGLGGRGPGPHTVDLMLPPGGSIRGRVTDEAGDPIPNAQVRVFGMSGKVAQYRGDAPRARSDENGYYHLQGVALGPGNISAYSDGRFLPLASHPDRDAHSTQYSGIPFTLRRAGAVLTQDLQLRQGVPISGKAVDSRGGPISGAEIKLSCESNISEAITDVDSAGVVIHTNADGEFEHPGIPPARWRVRAFADGRGAESEYFDVTRDAPPKELTLELREMPGVSGRLVGVTEEALKTLRVVLVSKEHSDEALGVTAAGDFSFDGLWPDPYTLEVRGALGLALVAPTPLHLAWGERNDDLELQLVTMGSIAVRTTTPDGRPAAGRDLRVTAGFLLGTGKELNQPRGNETISDDEETDDEGLMQLHALPMGRYTVADSSDAEYSCSVWPGEGEASLTVPDLDDPEDRVWFSTLVVDGRGAPIPLAAAEFKPSHADPEVDLVDDVFSDDEITTSVRAGRLHMSVPPGVTEGTLVITTARDAGGLRMDVQPVRVPITVVSPPDRIVMPAGLHIRGKAVDPSGNALPDVRVELKRGSETPGALTDQIKELSWVRTDGDGRFDIPALSPGLVTLALDGTNGHLSASVEDVAVGRDDVEIRLRAGTSISGTVLTPDGRPAADVQVRFDADPDSLLDRGSDNRSSWSGRTDANGEFRIRYLPLRATGSLLAEPASSASEPWLDTTVEDVASGAGDVVIKLRRGVMGYCQVRLPSGNLATEFEVSVSPASGNYWIRVSSTPSKGKFHFGPVAPGKYIVDLQPEYPEDEPGQVGEAEEFDLVGVTHTVTLPSSSPIPLTLGQNTPLLGHIRSPGGADWQVQVSNTNGQHRNWRPTVLDSRGVFKIDTDGKEDLTLYFWAPTERRMALVKSPRAGTPLTVRLVQGLTMSGVIRDFPVEGPDASIHLDGPHGVNRVTKVDERGSFACHGLPPGRYTIVLECRHGRIRRTKNVAPTTGLVLEYVQFGD